MGLAQGQQGQWEVQPPAQQAEAPSFGVTAGEHRRLRLCSDPGKKDSSPGEPPANGERGVEGGDRGCDYPLWAGVFPTSHTRVCKKKCGEEGLWAGTHLKVTQECGGWGSFICSLIHSFSHSVIHSQVLIWDFLCSRHSPSPQEPKYL